MIQTGIFYGSTMGNTAHIAKMIHFEMGFENTHIYDIKNAGIEELKKHDLLILGLSTWGFGHMQKDWTYKIDLLDKIDLSNKKAAIFCLGDQQEYPDTFVDAMGVIYEKLKSRGAKIIGAWPASDYHFKRSKALLNGHFPGLVIDEDHQSDRSKERVQQWVAQLRQDIQ